MTNKQTDSIEREIANLTRELDILHNDWTEAKTAGRLVAAIEISTRVARVFNRRLFLAAHLDGAGAAWGVVK